MQYNDIMRNGLTISSSGTTGPPKKIYRSPDNILTCMEVALDGQQITSNSRVLTVTRLTHAGGSLLQTLPAMHVGAYVEITTFNPYKFLKQIKDFTHTFLPPAMMKAVTKTKGWADARLDNIRIAGGSDRVDWDVIEQFVERGAIVQPNWGMSEVGPFCINAEYTCLEDISNHKNQPNWGMSVLGDTFYVDYKIVNPVNKCGELHIKSDMCVYDGWFPTGDLVYENNRVLYYKGRL